MKTVYLDMDGVVADWNLAAQQILGHHLDSNGRWPDADWQQMVKHQRFYRDLPLMPQARWFVSEVHYLAECRGYDVRFLTAVPHNNDFPWAFSDKMAWVQEQFPTIPVWFGPYSDDKQMRSEPGEILIDDRAVNCEQWRARGGWAIQYVGDAELALAQLRQYLA